MVAFVQSRLAACCRLWRFLRPILIARSVPPSPRAGATLAAAPVEVTLHFTEKIEPKFSTIVVRDAAGKQVDQRDSSVQEQDPQTLRVSLPALAPGRYQIEWRVTSVDTHSSRGEYSFRVGK